MKIKYPNITAIAFDMATTTGWAALYNGGILYGSHKVHRSKGLRTRPDDHVGIEYIQFLRWITQRFEKFDPDDVFAEESAGHWKSILAARKPLGFRAMLMATTAHYNAPVTLYTAQQLKKYATGKGNAKKPQMIQAAFDKYGITTSDDNVADALHCLHFGLSKRHGFELPEPEVLSLQNTKVCDAQRSHD